jgi:adenosylcobinamide-GDP ribazoletransferase
MKSLVAALRFLTRVPVPGPATQVEDLAGAVGWFPLVGALVGLAIAGVFLGLWRVFPAPVAAVLAIAFGLMLTGGFHEDGLTDAVDGLGGGFTTDKVLLIMKDSRIGAYGAMALWCALSFRFAALVVLGPRAIVALPLAMLLGRWSIALLLRLLPPIAEGLAKEVHRRTAWGPFLHSTALMLVGLGVGVWLKQPRLGIALGATVATTLLWAWRLKVRLGGHSGDLLGACAMLGEAAALLVWMAR